MSELIKSLVPNGNQTPVFEGTGTNGRPDATTVGFPFQGDRLHCQGVITGGGGFETATFNLWIKNSFTGVWGRLGDGFGGAYSLVINEIDAGVIGNYEKVEGLEGAERIYFEMTSAPATGTAKLWAGRNYGSD